MTGPTQNDLPRLHWIVLLIAAVKLSLHLVSNTLGGYGYFRDELYYLACTQHLDIGYVDHPPLSILILFISRTVLGDSLFAIRLLPALTGTGVVIVAALIARRLQGGTAAQSIAALAATVSPVLLGMDTIFSMNAFDILLWAFGYLLILRIIERSRMSDWVLLGFVIGFGALNKISMLFFACGFAVGLLLTQHRRFLKSPGPWIAAGIACVLFLPYVIWNVQHDFAHLEFIRNASEGKYSTLTPLRFLQDQILLNNPFSLPVWIGGILFFFTRRGKPYRLPGITLLTVALILLMNQTSKGEYLTAGMTLLFASGGVFLEQVLRGKILVWARGLVFVSLLAGFMIAPFGLPLLPVPTYIRYADALGISPSTAEAKELAELPQFYADMFGWEDQVRALGDVYHSLPREEQASCVIYASNYGRAGAVDLLGPRYGLPRVISGHNSYWLWGPGAIEGRTILLFRRDAGELREQFEEVTDAGFYSSPYVMPYENNLHIYLCRDPKVDLEELWRETRHYE